jgi:hypothetical protein
MSELVSICMNENIAESAAYSLEGRFKLVSDGNGNLKNTAIDFTTILGYSNSELESMIKEYGNTLGSNFSDCWGVA